MSDFENTPIDSRSVIGLRAVALVLSVENFFNGCISVGYGVSGQLLFSLGFICTTL